LSDLAKEIRDAAEAAKRRPPQFLPLKLDVGDAKTISEAATAVEKTFGRLDILINNAGILDLGIIGELDPDKWWRIWEVNVRGPYLMTYSFLPLLIRSGGGYIANTASVGAHLISPGASAYQASKAALVRFTEFINVEYGDKGILAFCIHPGNIPTDIVNRGEGLPEALANGKS